MIERKTKFDTVVSASGENSDVSVEMLFDVLGNPRRRHVLSYIDKRSTSVSVDELAQHVVEQESDTTVDEVPPDVVERITILLYHVHLPMMADVGLVAYDPDSGTVVSGETIELAVDCLELAEYNF
ncbi:DUF7344 domain-containing protein [Haladaptatus sp. NG-SE-30]